MAALELESKSAAQGIASGDEDKTVEGDESEVDEGDEGDDSEGNDSEDSNKESGTLHEKLERRLRRAGQSYLDWDDCVPDEIQSLSGRLAELCVDDAPELAEELEEGAKSFVRRHEMTCIGPKGEELEDASHELLLEFVDFLTGVVRSNARVRSQESE